MSELEPQFEPEEIPFSFTDDANYREPFNNEPIQNTEPEPNEPSINEPAEGQPSAEQTALAEVSSQYGKGWESETGIDSSIKTFYDPEARDTYTIHVTGEKEYAGDSVHTNKIIQEKFVSDLENEGISVEKFVDEKTDKEYAFVARLGAENQIEYFTFVRDLEVTEKQTPEGEQSQVEIIESYFKNSSTTPLSEALDIEPEQRSVVFNLDSFFQTEVVTTASIQSTPEEFNFKTFFNDPETTSVLAPFSVPAPQHAQHEKAAPYSTEEFLGIKLVVENESVATKPNSEAPLVLEQNFLSPRQEIATASHIQEVISVSTQEITASNVASEIGIEKSIVPKQPSVEIGTIIPASAEGVGKQEALTKKDATKTTWVQRHDVLPKTTSRKSLSEALSKNEAVSRPPRQNISVGTQIRQIVAAKPEQSSTTPNISSPEGILNSPNPAGPEGPGPTETTTAPWVSPSEQGHEPQQAHTQDTIPLRASMETIPAAKIDTGPVLVSDVIKSPILYTEALNTTQTIRPPEKAHFIPSSTPAKLQMTSRENTATKPESIQTPLREANPLVRERVLLSVSAPSIIRNSLDKLRQQTSQTISNSRESTLRPTSSTAKEEAPETENLTKTEKTTLYTPLGQEQIQQSRERVVSMERKQATTTAIKSLKNIPTRLSRIREQPSKEARQSKPRVLELASYTAEKPRTSIKIPSRNRNTVIREIPSSNILSRRPIIQPISRRPIGFVPDEANDDGNSNTVVDLIDTLRQAA